jgi:lipopolysaccharide heptosyltransferase II
MLKQYNRILLTRLKYIGDIVLTTPLIHTLRDRFPDAYIAYLGDKNGVSLLEQNPYLDEIFSIDFSRNTILQQLGLFYQLNRKHFDLVIDLFCNPRSALLSFATRAPVRVGGNLPGRGKLYTIRIKDDGIPKSAVEFHYQSLKAAGIEPKYFAPEIFLTEDEKKESRRYLEWQGIDFSKPIVALHPGGTWPAKLWPAERFADLADLLVAKMHAQIILTKGPRDGEAAGKVESAIVGGVLSLPVLPLRQLAAILSLCAACVANDSGPMHIAAAVGTPTIGLFGPGEENIWFPYTPAFPGGSPKHIALRKDVPCHPCHLNVCNRTGNEYMECMKLLSVNEVFNAVKERI